MKYVYSCLLVLGCVGGSLQAHNYYRNNYVTQTSYGDNGQQTSCPCGCGCSASCTCGCASGAPCTCHHNQ